jgi:Skp family chaperone for outer membrane proteins
MAQKTFFRYFLFFIALLYSNLSYANDKIYYLDIDFLMNNSLAGKSIINQLEKKNKLNVDNFKNEEEKLKKEESKIISQKSILSKEEFEKKVNLFNKKISNYKENRKNKITDLSNKKIEAQKALVKALTPILAEYSKNNSISYIIPKQNIIIGKSELDLTKTILEILNSKVKNIELK